MKTLNSPDVEANKNASTSVDANANVNVQEPIPTKPNGKAKTKRKRTDKLRGALLRGEQGDSHDAGGEESEEKNSSANVNTYLFYFTSLHPLK